MASRLFGGDGEDRTLDLCVANAALSQLSYAPTLEKKRSGDHFSPPAFRLAEMVGFEPTCPAKDKTISNRSRYDHFDTSPYYYDILTHPF